MNKVLCSLALAAAFAACTAVYAVSYNYDPGVIHETDAFASFSTTGAEMAGMGVHVEYVDGGTHNATLQFLSAGNGRVNDGSLFLNIGNTGNNSYAWLLQNSASRAIHSVSFDGQPGNAVFDVSFPFGQFAGFSFVGTPGTSTGREFDLHSIYQIYSGVTVTYSDAVALVGADPVGDVFRRMTVEFALNRPLGAQSLIEFRQDTDTLAFGSVLIPVQPASVPEGGPTIAMLCAGLAGLAATARRRGVQARAIH